MSFITGTVTELLYASTAVGASLNTFTTEAQLNTVGTMGVQAKIPANFWEANNNQSGRGVRIVARGLFSTTGTPTYQLFVRGGASGNITTAPLVLGTAAITTTSGAASAFWELEADIILTAIGYAGAHSTIQGAGKV